MQEADLRDLLEGVRSGAVAPDDALRRLRRLPFTDLGFARVDHHRALRQGMAEAVYAPGKSPQECAAIVTTLRADGGAGPIVLTRAEPDQAEAALVAQPDGVTHPGQPATIVWDAAPTVPSGWRWSPRAPPTARSPASAARCWPPTAFARWR